LDTSELQQTFDSGRRNETSTTGGWNQLKTKLVLAGIMTTVKTYANGDGTALSTLFGGQRVRVTKVGTPVSAADGNHTEFCDDDGSTNGSGNFLGSFDSEANMSLRVADDDDCLESRTLASTSLLLDGLDLNFKNSQQRTLVNRPAVQVSGDWCGAPS